MSEQFEQNMEHELETARMMIEAPNRVAFVLGIAVEGNHIYMARSASGVTRRYDAECICQALERELNRIRNLMLGSQANG